MRSLINMGIAASMFVCGMCLCAAETVSKANADAARTAAERGDSAAQFRYAEMLRDGRGVKKNVLESAMWMRKAADAGLAAAQCQMGLFYMNGLGVDRDEDKAVEWPSRFSPVPPPKATQVLRRNLKSLELKPRSEVGKVRILQTSKGA